MEIHFAFDSERPKTWPAFNTSSLSPNATGKLELIVTAANASDDNPTDDQLSVLIDFILSPMAQMAFDALVIGGPQPD